MGRRLMGYVMIQLDDVDNDDDEVSINIDFQPPLPEDLNEESELTPAQQAGLAISNFIMQDLFVSLFDAVEIPPEPDSEG